jgi:hypothetical protein
MRRLFLFVELIVLMIFGVAMVWFYATGRLDFYLVGWFRELALVGGLGIMVMGVFNWLMRSRNGGCTHDHHGDGGGAHDHGPSDDGAHAHGGGHSHEGTVGSRALTLLLLSGSMTTAAVLTPDAYSSKYNMAREQSRMSNQKSLPRASMPLEAKSAAAQQGGLTLALVEKYQPRNKEGNFELGILQLHYSGSDPEYAKIMVGQTVETVGQMVKDEINAGPDRARLFTLQMTCCAADARPYSIPLVLTGSDQTFREMGWYKIVGSIEYVEERGLNTAQLKVTRVTPTVRPREPRTI